MNINPDPSLYSHPYFFEIGCLTKSKTWWAVLGGQKAPQNLLAFTSQPGFLHGCWGSKTQTLMFAEKALCPLSPMTHFFRPILLFISGWTMLCCEHLPLILHPFTCCWTARLIFNLGYWESTGIHMDVWKYVWFSKELYKWVLSGSILGF